MSACAHNLSTMKLSKTDQESYVMQGLALGLLAHNRPEVPADKLRFEFALSHAFRRLPSRDLFPRVGAAASVDPYYLVTRMARRRGPLLASWDTSGRRLVPYVWNEGWSVQESGEMLASWSTVPWPQWLQFGADFWDDLSDET